MRTTKFEFDAIGTHWQIDIADIITPAKQTNLLEKIISLIEDFDITYSRFRKDSLVTKMSEKKGIYLLPDNAKQLLSLYKKLYALTEHAFTPLIGQVLVDAGYDAAYSLKPKTLHRPPEWQTVIAYNYPEIEIKKPVLLDFGAGGKGYLIDLVSDLLKKNSIQEFCVDAGGDMFYENIHDEKKLRVGLEHPDNPDEVIGVATIRNQSICASAGNRRRWKNFHHIINPKTLISPKEIKATWVVADRTLLADALATCLFFVPAKTLLKHFDFSYAIIQEDYSLEVSSDFPAEMFTS
jgi:thiamine biosynthesis lipoprotein